MQSTDATDDQNEDVQTAMNLWRVLSFEARRLNGGLGASDTRTICDTNLTHDFERQDDSAAHTALSRTGTIDGGATCVHANSLTGLANEAAKPFGTLTDSAICMNVPVPWYDGNKQLAYDVDPADIPLPDDSWPALEPQQRCAAEEIDMPVPSTPNATTDEI
jgi:hypothetical protein